MRCLRWSLFAIWNVLLTCSVLSNIRAGRSNEQPTSLESFAILLLLRVAIMCVSWTTKLYIFLTSYSVVHFSHFFTSELTPSLSKLTILFNHEYYFFLFIV